ncbi:MAG: transposase [Planctomycetota bacterium]
MTTARKMLVDPTVTAYYHCISRCVRRALLCGENHAHRKQWIEDRLRELAGIFAIDVCGFSIMDNHLHLLLRLNLAKAEEWSAEEVARRWLALCPPRGINHKPLALTPNWITERAQNAQWIAESRRRLGDLGWFMKFLKEPIARRANKEEECTGAFWEGRFKSIAILDEASLLATSAYIDLNPVAAGIAATPEKSPHTSAKARIEHCASQGTLEKLREGSPYVSKGQFEKDHWLFPIEDKRDPNGEGVAGMLHGISLTGYLQLLDWSSRLARPGKTHVSAVAPPLLARLQIEPGTWQATLEKLFRSAKKVGCYFGSTQRLDELAATQGRRFLKNVTGRSLALSSPNAG